MLKLLLLLGVALCGHVGPDPSTTRDVTPLWPKGNPGGWTAEEPRQSVLGDDGVLRVSHVETPTLTYHPPAAGSPAKPVAVIVCPGGGYRILALNKEGSDVASYLANHGFHALVLEYRLPNKGDTRYLPGLQDAQRAIRLVRQRQEELGITAVGIMGFSAGGHLSATAAAAGVREENSYEQVDAADQLSARPDFVGLIYPAYLLENLESQQLVPEVTPGDRPPPAFLVHALDDRIPARNSICYGEALAALKVPAEVHLFARGGHGYGMTLAGKLPVGDWPTLFVRWLERRTPR